jgi:hypothetical protein
MNDGDDMEEEDIYEEIVKKYILYQQLKREVMQGNEDILSNNENINSSKGDDNDISDIVNDEFYPTAEIQQKNNLENLELDEIEKSLNLLHLQMSKKKEKNNEETKNKYDLLLSKYKFIPKKHKFYLKYEYKNGKFMVKSKNKINTYENTFDIRKPKLFLQNNKPIYQEEYKNPYLNKNLIHMYSIQSIVSLRNLNNLNVKSYSKNKISQSFNEFNSKQKIFNLEDEKKQMHEEAKMYKAYNYYG